MRSKKTQELIEALNKAAHEAIIELIYATPRNTYHTIVLSCGKQTMIQHDSIGGPYQLRRLSKNLRSMADRVDQELAHLLQGYAEQEAARAKRIARRKGA
jgi:hypothetical protein